jgi:hypothetical protein
MASDPPEPTGPPHDDVFAQLAALASLEHSLCVEYLSVHCSLGHEREPASQEDHAQRIAQAARDASVAAFSEMRHLRAINSLLAQAGREIQLERAETVAGASGSLVAFSPLSRPQLEGVVARERELGSAVDATYTRLRTSLESASPTVEGNLLEDITGIFGAEPDHSGLAAALESGLAGIPPSEFIQAEAREPRDEHEERLLALSDGCYSLVVDALRIWFEHGEEVFTARSHAIDAMTALNGANRLLVEQGLVPSFTAAGA